MKQSSKWSCLKYACQVAEGVRIGGADMEQCREQSCKMTQIEIGMS